MSTPSPGPDSPRTRAVARSAILPGALLLIALVAAAVVIWLAVAEASRGSEPGPTAGPTSPGATTQTGAAEEPSVEPTADASQDFAGEAVFTIAAAGDVLPHDSVIAAARAEDGAWDFGPLWEPVTAWIAGADLAICNLEVPLAPPGSTPSGYPIFGAPTELAQNLADGGWDGCTTATNHAADRGWAGIVHTLDSLDAAGLGHAGTARTEAESKTAQLYVLERAGQQITVASIAATFSTNGLPIPVDAPWSVQMLDVDQLIDQATAAREAGADLVVASVHCCVEYNDVPTDEQVAIARRLADSGVVDLMIGNHSHVPQPMAELPGGPGGEGMWVAYSLGNFLSNQDALCCRPQTATGLLMTATVTKPVDGPARVSAMEWTAVTVDRVGDHRVYAVPDLLAGLTSDDLTLGADEVAARQQRVVDVVGPEASERTEPPVSTGGPAVVVPRS